MQRVSDAKHASRIYDSRQYHGPEYVFSVREGELSSLLRQPGSSRITRNSQVEGRSASFRILGHGFHDI
jgi:hypothetical protein